MKTYNEPLLKEDFEANCNRPYQQCAISVMDTIADPDISFDEKGISNYYYQYQEQAKGIFTGSAGQEKLAEMVAAIKNSAKNQKYDCILGLSGGADSTYLALLAKELKLNPLIVHFDYGWNTETAVQNIEQTVKKLGFDLYTYVMDWPQFRSLLRAYCKASVLDLDVPADHLIFAALSSVARKHKIKYMLKGYNITTEAILPRTWNYGRKFDLVNMKNIHSRFEGGKLDKIPKLGYWQRHYYNSIAKLADFAPLNYIDYDKKKVKQILSEQLGWVDYGGKHCENIFTRFYQGYILPVKFNIDKRKAHLSTLIFSGQMTKEEALHELAQPAYDPQMMEDDFEFIAKKLGFSKTEFESYINQPNRDHNEFGDELALEKLMIKLYKPIKPYMDWIRK